MNEIKPLTIYSKHCIRCQFHDELKTLTLWATANGYAIKLCRTVLDKTYHQEATKLWGDEDYPAFVEIDGKVKGLKEFMDDITKPKRKKKPVKEGKAK